MASSSPRAVLTGDLVDSSKLPPEERKALPGLLKRAGRELRQAFPKAVRHEVDVFRGDSWQMVVDEPGLAVRAGLFFRAGIIASSPAGTRWDTRLAIAVGAVDFLPARVSEGDGPAYRDSGRALDALAEQRRMSFTGEGAPGAAVVVALLDALVQEWTPLQARAVQGRLQGWTQERIRRLWPGAVSQQTVARHLARAHWAAVETALAHLENSLPGL